MVQKVQDIHGACGNIKAIIDIAVNLYPWLMQKMINRHPNSKKRARDVDMSINQSVGIVNVVKLSNEIYEKAPPKDTKSTLCDKLCVDLIGPYKIQRKRGKSLILKLLLLYILLWVGLKYSNAVAKNQCCCM